MDSPTARKNKNKNIIALGFQLFWGFLLALELAPEWMGIDLKAVSPFLVHLVLG